MPPYYINLITIVDIIKKSIYLDLNKENFHHQLLNLLVSPYLYHPLNLTSKGWPT